MPPYDQNNGNIYPTPTRGPMATFDPTQPIPKPKKHINVLLIPLILCLLFLIGAIIFGFWAYMSREDYKKNSDQKAAAAVEQAEKELSDKKEAEFKEREKAPLKQYEGPATFGSVVIQYPKTWGAFITQSDRSATPIDGYMHPNFVPGLQSGTAFALHFQVLNSSYDQELKKYEANTKSGKVQVTPASVPNVPEVAGVRITGEIEQGKVGTVVLFPLRDKTLKLVTESEQYNKDFNDIILANLTFEP